MLVSMLVSVICGAVYRSPWMDRELALVLRTLAERIVTGLIASPQLVPKMPLVKV